METDEFLTKLSRLLDEVKIGVLSSLDAEGKPHLRWMTPGLLPNLSGCLYAITSPDFAWVKALATYPSVEWMIQNKSVTEVIRIMGKAQIIDNPSLKAEILEQIGRYINIFWKVNAAESNFVVLETVLERAYYFVPMRGERIFIELQQEKSRKEWL